MKLIFSIESDWENSAKKQSSILPMLQCINGIYPNIKYIFRTANTKEEFLYCLKKFKQISKSNGDFCSLFLSGHGEPGQMYFGKEVLTLSDLADLSAEVGPRLFDGHLVHFDACSVLKDSEKDAKRFINSTGAALATGFTTDVDFIESLALEMLYIDNLTKYKRPVIAYKNIKKLYFELCQRTGFIEIRK